MERSIFFYIYFWATIIKPPVSAQGILMPLYPKTQVQKPKIMNHFFFGVASPGMRTKLSLDQKQVCWDQELVPW